MCSLAALQLSSILRCFLSLESFNINLTALSCIVCFCCNVSSDNMQSWCAFWWKLCFLLGLHVLDGEKKINKIRAYQSLNLFINFLLPKQ